jgi:hypothetical protein
MAQRDHRGMTTVLAPVFRLERLNLTVPLSAITIPGARHQDTPHYRNETSYARLGQGTR